LSFKEQNLEKMLGIPMLAELQTPPPLQNLCGTSGSMHFVCTIHQKVKLLVSGAKFYDLTEEQVKTYNCSSKIICNTPTVSCYLKDCDMPSVHCAGLSDARGLLSASSQRTTVGVLSKLKVIHLVIT
jgi:hypothetical protein